MSEQISQELAERMAACLRLYAAGDALIPGKGSVWGEAQEIVALLPEPVDPDLVEARKIAAARVPDTLTAAAILRGDFDRLHVSAVLSGIKRGRELALKTRAEGE